MLSKKDLKYIKDLLLSERKDLMTKLVESRNYYSQNLFINYLKENRIVLTQIEELINDEAN